MAIAEFADEPNASNEVASERWSTERLLARLQVGDEQAATPLHARFGRVLVAWGINRWGLSRDEAEDAYQDMWVSVLKSLRTFDPHRGAARAWLHKIYARQVMTSFRKGSSERGSVEAEPTSDAHQHHLTQSAFIDPERATLLREAWNELSPTEQQLIISKAGAVGNPGADLTRALGHWKQIIQDLHASAGERS